MAAQEIAVALQRLDEIRARLAAQPESDAEVRTATSSVVAAVMHHEGCNFVESHAARGEHAFVLHSQVMFRVTLGDATIEVTRNDDNLLIYFGQRFAQSMPLTSQWQSIPIPVLTAEEGLQLGRELFACLGAILEATCPRDPHRGTLGDLDQAGPR